jgi:thiazole synthase
MTNLKIKNNPDNNSDIFRIAGREFGSRLLVGTGRYKTLEIAKEAIEASGAEIVTVALRRVNLTEAGGKGLLDYISPEKYTFLPNSAGCYTADEAVRTLRLARASSGWSLVKLEVIGDKTSLYPDMPETLKAAEILVKEGFDVMVYCTDDATYAKRLEDAGCAAIMPLAAPIGSGLGIINPDNIRKIVENAKVPVLVDAGIGTASDAAIAMELGCDGVLMNAAISDAQNPVQMAIAMRLAVEAGRMAYLAGRMPKRQIASASSPEQGIIGKN